MRSKTRPIAKPQNVGINSMRRAFTILTILILAIGCNDNSHPQIIEKSEDLKNEKGRQDSENDTLKTFADTIKNEEIRTDKKKQTAIIDFNGTVEVRTNQHEIEFINLRFYNQLDSLIKFEKRCLGSSLKGLHWTFFKIAENSYELTASSDFGGTYIGYATIDNSVVFLSHEEPELYRRTARQKEFRFNNKKFSYTEDYSVWQFKREGNEMKITKSYTLPCD